MGRRRKKKKTAIQGDLLPHGEEGLEEAPAPVEPPAVPEPVLGSADPPEAAAEPAAEPDDGSAPAAGPAGRMESASPAEPAPGPTEAPGASTRVARPDLPVTPIAAWKHRLPALEDSGDFEAALDLVRDALLHAPADPELLVQEIHLLGTLGRFDDADEPLRMLRLSEGPTAEVRLVGGLLQFRRGRYPEAVAELREAIRLGDESGEAHYYLGESLNRIGMVEEALKVLSQAVDLNPLEARAYSTLGRLLDRKGLRDDAAAMYRKAREAGR